MSLIDIDHEHFSRTSKLMGLPLLLAVGGVATLYIDSGDLSGNALNLVSLLRFAVLLLAAPIYTIFVPIVSFIAVCLLREATPEMIDNTLRIVRIVGYGWVGVKLLLYIKENAEHRASEAEQECLESKREVQEAEQEKRNKHYFEAQRASTKRENRNIIAAMVELVKIAGSQAREMRRVARVMQGGNIMSTCDEPPEELVLSGTLQILGVISQAYGAVPDEIARLYHGIQGRLDQTSLLAVHDCAARLEIERSGSIIRVPAIVLLLAVYDQTQGTTLSALAASTYCSLVRAASDFCSKSVAVKVVANSYTALLSPYMLDSRVDRDAASSHSSSSRSGTANQQQSEMVGSLEILGLRSDATQDDIRSAYRDLAKVWHPDRFSEKDTRLRKKAEEKFREIQRAYEFIKKHSATSSSSL